MFKIVAHPARLAVFFALLACVAACMPKPTPTPLLAGATTSPPLGQLPRTVTPVLYDLALTVDPAQESYRGKVDVAVQVHRPVQVIYLHGQDLKVTSTVVLTADGQRVPGTYQQITDDGVAQVVVDQALRPGLATISLVFEAPFSTKLNGLYRVVSEGVSYVYTQFEPLSARRAFPCFDEPGFKTPWQVTVTVPEDQTAIGNTMPMGEQRAGDGTKMLVFSITPALPTYLLALAVGPFEVQETTVPANVVRPEALTLRGVAAKGQGHKLTYAVQHTGDLLQGLERYFGQAYPFPKLDLVAVPDFAAGAMENAGAVTFRDWLILLDPATLGQTQLRGFAYVVAHELAHQWFGDDVTMQWWNDLWLNEAFATWMGYKIANEWDPDLRLDLQFAGGVHDAMRVDALAHTRKIHQPCDNHDDVHNAFDSITYLKGGGVLRMFEHYAGADKFQAGVRGHVRAHHFQNANSAEFLQAVESVSGVEGLATDFMSFLDQPGVPDVHVAVDCNGTTPTMTLTQARFKPVGSTIDPNSTWRVPLCWRAGPQKGDVAQGCVRLTAPTQQVDLPFCPAWIMPDADGAGYYHWQLDAEHVAALHKAPLSPGEQQSMGSNLSAAFSAATLPGDQVLKALAPLAAAKNYFVAVQPFGVFDFAYREILQANSKPAAAKWLKNLYGGRLKALGFVPKPNEKSDQLLMRRQLVRFFVETLHEPTQSTAMQNLGEAFIGYAYDGQLHPEVVSADLTDIALVAAANARGAGYTQMLISALRGCNDAALRRQMVAALGRIIDADSAAMIRAFVLDPALRLNEVEGIISGQLHAPEVREAAWAWFKNNFDALQARLPAEHLGSAPGMASGFCTGPARDDVEAFFSEKVKALAGGPRTLAQALEAINLCRAVVAAQSDSVAAMFRP